MPGVLNDKASLPPCDRSSVDLMNTKIAEIVLDRIFLAVAVCAVCSTGPFFPNFFHLNEALRPSNFRIAHGGCSPRKTSPNRANCEPEGRNARRLCARTVSLRWAFRGRKIVRCLGDG